MRITSLCCTLRQKLARDYPESPANFGATMFRLIALAVTLAAAMATLPATAMEFSVVRAGSGQTAILAAGEIIPGDAARLARALRRASPDAHGTRRLLLDSPGGSVVDALDMADLINDVGVTTVVPARALCASACASVLFVAGRYRTVEKGGQLLIHSCFDARSGRKMDQCDAYISARAQQQGISGRAMMAFQEMAPGPDYGVIFDAKDAACFGLTRAPGKAALGDNAPCIQAALHGGSKKKKKR